MSKHKVVIIHPSLAPYRVDLFNALGQRFDLRILFLSENPEYQSYDQKELRKNLKCEYEVLKNGIDIMRRQIRWGVRKKIQEFSPDVVITHEFSPTTLINIGILKGTFKNEIKQIIWTADNPYMLENELFLRIAAKHLALRNTDGLIVYSNETQALYRDRYKFQGPIGVSGNLQDESFIQDALRTASNRSMEIANDLALFDKRIVLFVGRLAKVKRVDRILRSFEELVKDAAFEKTVLALIGDGPEKVALQRMVRELGIQNNVLFLGHLSKNELFAWYRLGACLVLPSEFEPWGAVVNEALVAGIPVICSEKAGAKELIREGITGSVLDTDGKKAFSSILRQWCLNSTPLSPDHLKSTRESLMNVSFQQAVDGFYNLVEDVLKVNS